MPRNGRLFFWASALVLAACALILLGMEIAGEQLADLRRAALPLLVLAVLFGGLALVAWWRDRAALAAATRAEAATRSRLETELEHARGETARARREAEDRARATEAEGRGARGPRWSVRPQRSANARRSACGPEQRSRVFVEKARQAERQWAQELRSQVVALHRRHGVLSNPEDDPPGSCCRPRLSLLGAEKGMMISRPDGPGRAPRGRAPRGVRPRSVGIRDRPLVRPAGHRRRTRRSARTTKGRWTPPPRPGRRRDRQPRRDPDLPARRVRRRRGLRQP
jgi:hypothetical protein